MPASRRIVSTPTLVRAPDLRLPALVEVMAQNGKPVVTQDVARKYDEMLKDAFREWYLAFQIAVSQFQQETTGSGAGTKGDKGDPGIPGAQGLQGLAGPAASPGPPGDPFGNLDGGNASSIYGGIFTLDGGAA